LSFQAISAQSDGQDFTVIANNLWNPRGVAVLADARLVVAEAGTGYVGETKQENTGRLSIFEDLNKDGDYNDEGERTIILNQLPGYNILYQFQPGRDEVVGVGDVLALDDGRIFFTLDDHLELLSIMELSSDFKLVGNLYESAGTLNAIAYDSQSERIYVAESSLNLLSYTTLDGESGMIAPFGLLAHNQQAVPSGIAIDPTTGDLLVTLFSGQLWDYYGKILSFMPGDSKVVRINPETGEISDEITGLTTAVDLAVDKYGNLFVVELTTEWPTPTLDTTFDLYDPDAAPDAGGYARNSGRVTMYPADGSPSIILAEDIDEPTNITYYEGNLYISLGQGTPNRPIWVDDKLSHIEGQILMIPSPVIHQ